MNATFTIITATDPTRLTKRFRLDERDNLVVDPGGELRRGRAEVRGIGGLDDFAAVLIGLRTDQALLYGCPTQREVAVTTRRDWARRGRPAGWVARTNEHFPFRAGPGVLMLDHDPLPGRTYDREDLHGVLSEAVPGLVDVSMLWWTSASSFIYRGDQELRGLRGQRLYVLVKDARDIPRAGKAIIEHLWAAGIGHASVSRAGTALPRTLFDGSVWQGSRLDFAAGADCVPPLEQRRGEPVRIGGTIEIVDSETAIPDPTPEVSARFETKRQAAVAAVREPAERVRAHWIGARTAEIAGPDATPERRERAERMARRAVEQRSLNGDFTLDVFGDGGEVMPVTVGAILDDPPGFHGRLTRDPLEPDYGGGRAVGKLFLYGGPPNLFSFAHGGATYRLVRQPEAIEVVTGRMRDVVEQSLEALRKLPDVFDFGNDVVKCIDGQLVILDDYSLRHTLAEIVQYQKQRKVSPGEFVRIDADPPQTLTKTILSLGRERGLKRLTALVTAPTLRPDGSLITQPGYDATSGLLIDVDPDDLVSAPDEPDWLDALIAAETLMRPFRYFPFVTDLDRSVLLAALVSAVIRPALPTCPGFGIDAPTAGTGKTLLAQCVAALATGKRIAPYPPLRQDDEAETRKRIGTALQSGDRVIIWDNIVGTFESASLAMALTGEGFADRVLGEHRRTSAPNRTLFLFTGNNLTLNGQDIIRRILKCRLDAKCEMPHLRTFDADPLAEVVANRQALVAAALTIVRAWVRSGDNPTPSVLGSFELWDRFVRQPIAWLKTQGVPRMADVAESIKVNATVDLERDTLGRLYEAWVAVFGVGTWVPVRDLVTALDGLVAENDAFAAAFLEIAPSVRSGVAIGKFLGHRRGRISGGLVLERRRDTGNNAFVWSVGRVQKTAEKLQKS